MQQQFTAQPQFKTRSSVLVFLKGTAAPIVLYFENPTAVYEEFSQIMKANSPTGKLIEKDAIGPVKKFCVMPNQICGLAIQEEQFI